MTSASGQGDGRLKKKWTPGKHPRLHQLTLFTPILATRARIARRGAHPMVPWCGESVKVQTPRGDMGGRQGGSSPGHNSRPIVKSSCWVWTISTFGAISM